MPGAHSPVFLDMGRAYNDNLATSRVHVLVGNAAQKVGPDPGAVEDGFCGLAVGEKSKGFVDVGKLAADKRCPTGLEVLLEKGNVLGTKEIKGGVFDSKRATLGKLFFINDSKLKGLCWYFFF